MKKQYRYSYNIGFKKYFYLYHDGVLVKKYPVWGDDMPDEIERLEILGYTHGYLNIEIEQARKEYMHMLKNMIIKPKGEEKEQYDIGCGN